jgi:Holliday junction resolvase RusA-like endonuclease
MELVYAITINEEPVPQARARATILKTKDGRQWINFYTPAKSENFKKLLQKYMHEGVLPEILLDEPLILEARFYKTKPKSAKRVWLTTKPDLDNYIKAVKDAMSGLIYRDDSIIVGYKDCWKLYGRPRIEIKLLRLGGT